MITIKTLIPPARLVCRDVLPLWPVAAAVAWLRQPEAQILAWVDAGRVGWAWNLGRRAARHREIRLWFRSLEALKLGVPEPDHLTPDEVADAVIGHARPTLRAVEVAALLNCHRSTVTRFLVEGELRAAETGRPRRGPHSSVSITRDSLVKLLVDRRVV